MVKYEMRVDELNPEGVQEWKYGESCFQCDDTYGTFFSEQNIPLGEKIEVSTEADGTAIGIIVRAELV